MAEYYQLAEILVTMAAGIIVMIMFTYWKYKAYKEEKRLSYIENTKRDAAEQRRRKKKKAEQKSGKKQG